MLALHKGSPVRNRLRTDALVLLSVVSTSIIFRAVTMTPLWRRPSHRA